MPIKKAIDKVVFNYQYTKLPAINSRAKILAFGQSLPASGGEQFNIARGVFLKRCWQNKNSSALNLLSDQKARGDALIPWAALRAAPPSRGWEPIYKIARTYFTKNY
jgi:hypothetical protein